MTNIEYAGFWIRTGAALIDTVLMLLIVAPLLTFIYGTSYWTSEEVSMGIWDVLLNHVLPAVAVILFWIYRSATPGKLMLKLSIIDAKTMGKPSTGQLLGRYFAYYLSILPLFLGLIWVGFDKRKQGWHDKLASTLVVKGMDKQAEEALADKPLENDVN